MCFALFAYKFRANLARRIFAGIVEVGGLSRDVRIMECSLSKDVEPDLAAFGHGLLGMDEADAVAEGLLEDTDKLASKGNFGDEKDNRLVILDGFGGELEVDIGLATTGNAAEEAGVARGFLEGSQGLFLGGVERDFG